MEVLLELLKLFLESILDVFIFLQLLVDLLVSQFKLGDAVQDLHGCLLWGLKWGVNSQVIRILIRGLRIKHLGDHHDQGFVLINLGFGRDLVEESLHESTNHPSLVAIQERRIRNTLRVCGLGLKVHLLLGPGISSLSFEYISLVGANAFSGSS